jgi:site-specific recombinase XerD
MAAKLIPLFDTFKKFQNLNFTRVRDELPVVQEYLSSFPESLNAVEGYTAVRGFLKSYAGNEATFNSYRTHVERMLLWSLLVAKKPLLELTRTDAQAFMDFCLSPLPEWIGPIVKSRFIRIGGRKALSTDIFEINPEWRPFNIKTEKSVRKLADEQNRDVEEKPYKMSQGSVGQVFAVCGSFFKFAADEGYTDKVNPFRSIKQKSQYKQRNTKTSNSKSLTPMQWDFVLETAEQMALETPSHERTLFILATAFSMYLRVSDLVGRGNWKPQMNSFLKDTNGNWWLHVTGKGNKAAQISVRDDYLEYLKRYRNHLNMTPLPSPDDKSPLLTSLRGRAGLSDRHIRLLLQEVFDKSLERMKYESRTEDEINSLRAASLHWLRHTSATFDAPYRDDKDLQADLRHESLKTTQDTYYNTLDEQRAHSVKKLGIRDRG